MTTHPPTTDHTDQGLTDAVTAVAAEISRTDNKASLLLAFSGALAAGLVGLTGREGLSLPVRLTIGAALTALGAAAVVLLSVVRPRLPHRGETGDRANFTYWAECTPAEIRQGMREDRR
ncbi:Pycsar system effector family protein, partial [Streptomyces buecherae]|uniref:Pycsar system effector family protein n=1 Tax=Streptomyces buecherae TaxID=2763006 RepID=UPI0015915361